MTAKTSITVVIMLLLSLAIAGCSKDPVSPDTATTDPTPSDYSKSENWLALSAPSKEVDIFYLYPTAWQKVDSTDPDICEVNNASMMVYAPRAFARQATAFETAGNLFAPYYRQLDLIACSKMTRAQQDSIEGILPKTDILAAFDYFIKHKNNGRPYILASHSQGSRMMLWILSDYMKAHPDVYARMIAAYVIGYSITPEYLAQNPHLKFAAGPDDNGVIVSFNTEAPEVSAPGNPVVFPGAMAINPITWTRTGTLATADKNLGSILLNADGTVRAGIPNPIMNFADARVDTVRGVVVCSTADVNLLSPGNRVFGRGVFHSFDYAFYYYNIRANALNRINKYFGRD